MLNVTDLRNGAVYKEGGQLLQVLTYEHVKMGRGSGTIKVKVRNLKTGSTTEKSFITGARVEEVSIEKKKAQYLYSDGENYYFMDPLSFEQFPLSHQIVGGLGRFLTEGLEVTIIIADEAVIALELPNFLIFTISQTGPGEKGNTVSNVYKEATMENGLEVKVPMFTKVGDKIKVDTRTGEYIERVK
ncbi:MAG: elongation factor P [Armatimonadetes bacterium]|nr:MAG: elongation factor P [Armatimonadota bacterium]